ncbi:MAG: 23S rRNA (guanosine(2251)-2'-O)-methyltransferase RlmB [Bacteroidota bacterium]
MTFQRKDDTNRYGHSSNLIYGVRPIIEAILAGREIEKILLQHNLRSEIIRELMQLINEREVPFQTVPIEKLNRLGNMNHQGVAAFMSEVVYQPIENVLPGIFESGKVPLLMILDRITDVRNLGAIVRTAECAGVDAIIIPSRGSAQINADAVKTSAGAMHRVSLCRSPNLKDTIIFLKDSGISVIAATEQATGFYNDADLTVPLAIIMGSEENGVSPEYLRLANAHVKIPLMGEIASLNVSVAAGVMLFEAIRQRGLA